MPNDHELKEGDRVRVADRLFRDCCPVGRVLVVGSIGSTGDISMKPADDLDHMLHWEGQKEWHKHLELITEEGDNMSTTSKKILELTLTEDDRLMRKYGLEDENGKYTEEGRIVLANMLWAEKRKEIVAQLKDVETKEHQEKKKNV